MKELLRKFPSLIIAIGFLANSPAPVFACGPFSLDPVFSFTKHGSYPLSDYARGKVGIVLNSYGRMSLFVFYRYLNDLPLTQIERAAVVDALEHRIGTHWSEIGNENAVQPATQKPDALDEWLAARRKFVTGETKIEREKYVRETYSSHSNCLDDAFRNAAKTLAARARVESANESLKEWIRGQDKVFANCSEGKMIPDAAPAGAPDWLVRDRAYQIAAARFYSGDLATARNDFEQISHDANSPWRNTAKFLIARTLIREASFALTINYAENETQKAVLKEEQQKSNALNRQALESLRGIISDSSMSEFHSSANRLVDLVLFRLNPKSRKAELAQILVSRSENKNLYNDLTDYIWLLDRGENSASEENAADSADDGNPNESHQDLTDWLFSYQSGEKKSFQYSFEKWNQTKSLAWFVAAISKAQRDSANVREILAEAEKISSGSPAFATARFHQARLLIELERRAEAREKLDALSLGDYPVSTQNDFLSLKMVLAKDLNEFLKLARRRAAAFVWSDDANESGAASDEEAALKIWSSRLMFDSDAVAFINTKMPLSVLREAAMSKELPDYLKKFFVIAVWTRAVILKNKNVEREFAPVVARYAPEFSPAILKYQTARGANDSEAAALLAILRNPKIDADIPVGYGRENSSPDAIDSIRGNWWYSLNRYRQEDSEETNQISFSPNSPVFLNAAQTAEADGERSEFAACGAAATCLARRAVEFALAHPRHAQVPELLHFAVRATRFGETDAATRRYSKQAFDILHKKFPRNQWTKKTPYYFGSES